MAATSIGPVRSPNYQATSLLDVHSLLTGTAALDFASPTGRLSVKSVNPQLGELQLLGIDDAGRTFVYADFSEPVVGGIPVFSVHTLLNVDGNVTGKGFIADGTMDIASLPTQTAALDFSGVVGRLSAKSPNPELAAIQLIGTDEVGRTFTYMECAEPTVGKPLIGIYTPLQVSGKVTAPFYLANGGGSDTDWLDGSLMIDFYPDGGRFLARGTDDTLAAVTLVGASSLAGGRSINYLIFSEPSGEGSGVGVFGVPVSLPQGISGNVRVSGNLTVEGTASLVGDVSLDGNLTVANLQVQGDVIVDGDLQGQGDVIVDGDLQGQRADFTSCYVNGSPVLTEAALPPDAIPYPPAGIGVSTGVAWATSINATNPVFAGTVTANLKMKAMGYLPFDLTKTYVSIGTGNPASPPVVPDILMMNAAAPLDQKITLIGASATAFYISATQDSGADHAWLWAHRSNFAITALDLIVNSNAGAGTITGASSGLTIGWHLTGTVGETDFVNNRAGGGGGFNWYNAAPGDVLTNASAALMKLDAGGNLSTAGTLMAANGAIRIGQRQGNDFGNGLANINSDGTNLAINPAHGANGIFFNFDQGTNGVQFCDGATRVVAHIDGAGTATFTGLTAMNPGIAVGGKQLFVIGVDAGAYNGVYFGFSNIAGSGSSSNLGVMSLLGGQETTFDASGSWHFPGTITAAGKSFAVPHPLIEGKDLLHACLEGPENGVFYRGEVVTKDGYAEVELPDYFEALTYDDNRSVLLTQVIESDDEPIALLAATRIIEGKFHIRAAGIAKRVMGVPETASVRVAWEVKAVRRIGVDRLEIVRASNAVHEAN